LNGLSGVRLSFCDNTIATLKRLEMPSTYTKVDFSNNYYDV